MTDRQWRPATVAGYDVSDDGLVRRSAPGKKTFIGRLVSVYISKSGYPTVGLYNGQRSAPFYVHRLVVEAFSGPIPHGMMCDHIDRNRRNNHISNLRIVSVADNNRNRALVSEITGRARGVTWIRKINSWRVRDMSGKHIGYYKDYAEAESAAGKIRSPYVYTVPAKTQMEGE